MLVHAPSCSKHANANWRREDLVTSVIDASRAISSFVFRWIRALFQAPNLRSNDNTTDNFSPRRLNENGREGFKVNRETLLSKLVSVDSIREANIDDAYPRTGAKG